MKEAAIIDRLRMALPGLASVWLFGSEAAGDAGPASDIDLAVLVDGRADPRRVGGPLVHTRLLDSLNELHFDRNFTCMSLGIDEWSFCFPATLCSRCKSKYADLNLSDTHRSSIVD